MGYFHVFSYSEREQAKSKSFSDQVSEIKIKSRSKKLRSLSAQKQKLFHQKFLGTSELVLFEQFKIRALEGDDG